MAAHKIILAKTIIIDGHNLIPKVAGLSLEDPDDEERLIARLNAYARQRGKQIEVFFDKAAPGQAGKHRRGAIQAFFVPAEMIADEAIRRRVTELGKQAKNVSVVSSDNWVQAEVRARGAQVVSSDAFAAEMAAAAAEEQSSPNGAEQASTPVDQWLDVFGLDPQQAEQLIDLGKKPKKEPQPKKPPTAKKRPRHGFTPKQ